LFLHCPSIFTTGELWDVDKFLDSQNNREPEKESVACVVTAYISVNSGKWGMI